jgi:hypothetical protein
MNFYNQQHRYYCGIDLHARKMYVCILDQKGKTMVHENIKTDPEAFFQLVSPYLEDIVVGVECVFCWHWVSDLCAKHQIPFVLGHALHMKAVHTLYLLRSIPGVGLILALVFLYEIQDVRRFPSVQDFSSYARLIKPTKESDGKWAGKSNSKIGRAVYFILKNKEAFNMEKFFSQ